MPDCPYCDTESQTEGELTAHLDEGHSREELSRVDRKRVEKHAAESGARSRLGRVVPDGRLSRRATLVAAGTALAGIGVGIGRRMSQTPTQIQDWNDLDNVRTGLSDDYVLANDLDQNTAGYSGTGDDFDPIGDTGSRFQGTFDGNGHTISDLTIEVSSNPAGLFGATDGGAEIKNLTIAGAGVTYGTGSNIFDGGGVVVGAHAGTVTNVSASGSLTTDGGFDAGGVVGNNQGTVTGSMSDVTVDNAGFMGDAGGLVGVNDGGTVTNCVATGDVSVDETRVGGLVGTNDQGSLIRDSYATGNVTNGDRDVGGLAGSNQSSSVIERCYATGDVVSNNDANFGGLVGDNSGATVRNSYALGDVDTSGTDNVGGLVGRNRNSATATETYAAGSVTGQSDVGGLVGDNTSTLQNSYWDTQTTGQTDAVGTSSGTETNLAGLMTSQMQGSDAQTNMSALSFSSPDTWTLVVTNEEINPVPEADGYPILTPLDPEAQLSGQGVPFRDPLAVVKVDGADNATLDNVTVRQED